MNGVSGRSEMEDVAKGICSEIGLDLCEHKGAGQFKHVFRVVNGAGENLALKIASTRDFSSREKREVQSIQRCDHPNIAKILGWGIFKSDGADYNYILEEYLDGGTLSVRIRPYRANARLCAEMAILLVGAISHMRDRDLVHRDIKPDNILFRGNVPVLSDFGLVRVLTEESLTQSWWDSGPGTPFYASPEQLLNEKSLIDWRSDQFSLGVTLSIAMHGRHPYSVSANEAGATAVQRAGRKEPVPDWLSASLDPFDKILAKMVAPWPYQRYRVPAGLSGDLVGAKGLL